jgi:hypothetical protein
MVSRCGQGEYKVPCTVVSRIGKTKDSIDKDTLEKNSLEKGFLE